MSIEDTEANLYRRSQFVVEHDTTATEAALRAELLDINERRQALESLDNEWTNANLNEPVRDAAEKMGHTYIMSNAITPHGFYEDTKSIKLPLRLGSRIREVFHVGDETATVLAARGTLLMYRTLDQNNRIHEAGFYTLLAQLKDQPAPILTFGSLDMLGLQSWQLSELEVALCGRGDFFSRNIARVDRDDLKPFRVDEAIQKSIEDAKSIAGAKDGETWQEVFNYRHNRKKPTYGSSDTPYRDSEQDFMDDVFSRTVEVRRFRKDKVSVGIFRSNEVGYVEGESAKLAIGAALQSFFNHVTDPIATRPDQRQAAVIDLEHGITIERLDAGQISEIDIAKSIIKRAAKDRTKAAPAPSVKPLDGGVIDRLGQSRIRSGVTFDDYPETKAILDEIYPKIDTSANKIGSDGIDWEESIRWSVRTDAARGEWSTLWGGHSEFDRMVKRIAALKEIKPSPKAFPFD